MLNLNPFVKALAWTGAAMEYEAREREYLETPLSIIDEERFEHMLGVLPPLMWGNTNGLQRFCLSEMQIGNITRQFAMYNGKYYERFVDVKKPATFITIEEITRFDNA